MKSIVFVKENTAELLDEEKPQIEPGKVLVKLAVSTISSGTERANITGDPTVNWNKNDPVAHFPRRLGYSSSGIVEEVGQGVTTVKPGDRVAMSWSKHSEYCLLAENLVYKIEDESISFEEAALWHIGTFPMAAIRKCRLEFGESAIVMGQGILGQFAVAYLRAAGAVPIIVADPIKEKREEALKLGADFAFDPYEEGFAEKVKAVTGGGVKVAIEVTGSGKALDQVLDCMAKFGRVALLGCTRNSDFTIDYYRKIHGPGITLVGAHASARPKNDSSNGWWTQRDDVMAEISLHRYGRVNLSAMIKETHSPAEATEVYNRLVTEKSFPLVQFDWRLL